MDVSLGGSDLFTVAGFALQTVARPSGKLRSAGYAVPGLDGVQAQLATALEHDAYELMLDGFVKGSTAALRSLILGTASWRSLVFSDQYPKSYQVQGRYVDEGFPRADIVPVTVGLLVSPPCLLGATVTDSSSPVTNLGDYICPATWTITAAGNFTLTVGTVRAVWTGGAGTVVINSETFSVTKNGTAAPQYLRGGYPWLIPGNNTVSLTAGSTFSCSFNPRYA